MSQKHLVLVVNDYGGYYTPFSAFGKYVTDVRILDDARHQDVSLVVFTGGSDVSPSLYGEESNNKTFSDKRRDVFEKAVFEKALKLRKNIVGICRGSQFLCAMSGGKLVQHITNHLGSHSVVTDGGEVITVTSTHHQMQLPPKNAIPIAWAQPKRSSCYEGPPGVEYKPDLEYDVVWYPKTNSLGIQYHPEFMQKSSKGFQYAGRLVERFFDLQPIDGCLDASGYMQ